ncbi:hypothetical protein Bbelb_173490 [Branchiostoma belcheri]|nr:hypothetical protein Bbelb_173490 [Branchiostoma belcheri]
MAPLSDLSQSRRVKLGWKSGKALPPLPFLAQYHTSRDEQPGGCDQHLPTNRNLFLIFCSAYLCSSTLQTSHLDWQGELPMTLQNGISRPCHQIPLLRFPGA